MSPRWFRSLALAITALVLAAGCAPPTRLAALKDEKLVTRIAVLSTSLGRGKTTQRLMIGMSVETHKASPDFDQEKCNQAKSRIVQALGDIDCDVFIEMDR